MKKVLIVSNNFHSLESIGSIRIRGLEQYLPQFGWEPVILTQGIGWANQDHVITIAPPRVQKANIEAGLSNVIGQGSKGVGKFASKVYKNLFWYPDPYHHWRREGKKTGRQILLHDTFDAMISSAHAVSSHIIASDLVSEFGIPWIADFRDLWTQNHYNSHFKARTLFERRLEIHTLKNADALVTVSEPLSDKIAQLHENRPIFTIPNGFDPDQLNKGSPLTEELTITYTGNLYRGRRDPTILFKVLREMFDQNLIPSDRISINFYGRKEPWLYELIKKFELSDITHVHGNVSREESIEKQRMSQLLLLLTWDNPEENGVYTGKLFDYLAARRPILSLGLAGGGVVGELLEDTNSGVHASDEETLKEILATVFREFNEAGAVQYQGIESRILRYSQIEMARRFAEVLNMVSSPESSI